MRPSVHALASLGTLPPESSATPAQLRVFEAALAKVEAPLAEEEAVALLPLFGGDNCFDLAWALLHLVETAPALPRRKLSTLSMNAWIARLVERAS